MRGRRTSPRWRSRAHARVARPSSSSFAHLRLRTHAVRNGRGRMAAVDLATNAELKALLRFFADPAEPVRYRAIVRDLVFFHDGVREADFMSRAKAHAAKQQGASLDTVNRAIRAFRAHRIN